MSEFSETSTPSGGSALPLTLIDGIIRVARDQRQDGLAGLRLPVKFTKEHATQLNECAGSLGFTRSNNTWRHDGPSIVPALYLARATLEVLYDASLVFPLLSSDSQFSIVRIAAQWASDDFVKFAKFITAWPMARYLQQDLPETPVGFNDHPLLFNGLSVAG
jgi:hypothetical protein